MLRFLKGFFSKPTPPEPQAPYKVEAPQSPDVDAKAITQVKCGCGRSPSGFCLGLHSLTPEEWATHTQNPHATKETPKKKRTFVKRKESDTAKVAKVKTPPKTTTPRKPKTK